LPNPAGEFAKFRGSLRQNCRSLPRLSVCV